MVSFPNAKINIGLNIIQRRSDGYHNIETVFYPVEALYDVLEMVEAKSTNLTTYGLEMGGNTENNLIIKALRLLQKTHKLPELDIYLKKNIPMGAGLGGGSADGSFALKMINELFCLHLTYKELEQYASQLGADCAFFINNKPVFAEGKGDVFSNITLSLQGKYIYIVKPDVSVSTADAYKDTILKKWDLPLQEAIKKPLEEWKYFIFNDFEDTVFNQYPQISQVKQKMYDFGAVYASMSGSGSAVYGIFNQLQAMPDEVLGFVQFH
ncbi:MAG: 4-(cytidine 5'-diphospho)-2-C-methyl-D-erythritol kinase [Prevotellaceae bacterium]|jgi:4-diphosphocytidyl-2-C-methyl-D-erythritol kinase|nr:4-(cytidine 5'-diphospho)-2-C-methyl-D-erythritol kinase [Prevotellaceae bacterium]